jgi:hypothetical protein
MLLCVDVINPTKMIEMRITGEIAYLLLTIYKPAFL